MSGFLIWASMASQIGGHLRRGAERRVVLPGDVIAWKRQNRSEAYGQVCENTFTRGGRIRVIEIDDHGKHRRPNTVHPVRILRHVMQRIDLVLLRPCPGCGGDPKRCACPTWAPLEPTPPLKETA